MTCEELKETIKKLKWEYEDKKIRLDYNTEQELERINGAILVLEELKQNFIDL